MLPCYGMALPATATAAICPPCLIRPAATFATTMTVEMTCVEVVAAFASSSAGNVGLKKEDPRTCCGGGGTENLSTPGSWSPGVQAGVRRVGKDLLTYWGTN